MKVILLYYVQIERTSAAKKREKIERSITMNNDVYRTLIERINQPASII